MNLPQLNSLEEAYRFLDGLDDDALDVLDAYTSWAPLPGPQTQAWLSQADELFYGGAAGGGKTDFIIGLALEEHRHSVIYRREAPQLNGITERMSELLGGRDLFHGQDKVWRPGGGRRIEYGSMPNVGDEQKQQGRPRDLLVFDEITQFLKEQYTYLKTWNRTTDPNQRCRIVVTGNPPTTPEGLWVTQYWGPWLDKQHALYGKVEPGELVWYVTFKGEETIVPDGGPCQLPSGEWVFPKSRTFIPSKVEQNPFLIRSGYTDTLEALPEPLRSMMRHGDFQAGQSDHQWQVIPSAWVDAAQVRWRLRQHEDKGKMDSIGVDPARGGADNMVLSPRHGSFFAEQILVPGRAVPDGKAGGGLVVQHMANGCAINVDVVGIGTSVVDHLTGAGLEVTSLHGAAGTEYRDKTGTLRMTNLRAAMYWHMRELLDPANPDPIALPPSTSLKSDLCAPRYVLGTQGVQVESKEQLMKPARLGRSPDEGDACVYAAWGYDSSANMSQLTQGEPDTGERGYKRPTRVITVPGQAPEQSSSNGWGIFKGELVYPDD